MKRNFLSFVIVIMVFSFGCEKTISQGKSKLISAREFSKKTAADPKAVVLDLRTDEEVKEGIIDGALQYNFYDETFKQNISLLDKDKNYYVYCKSGGRSAKAAAMMAEMGFNVFDLKGGITAWRSKKKGTVEKEVTF